MKHLCHSWFSLADFYETPEQGNMLTYEIIFLHVSWIIFFERGKNSDGGFFALKKYSIRIASGLFVVVAFILHAAHIVDYGYLDRMELLSYDLRLNLTLPHHHDSNIVIVDIDEKSLAEDGRWPWGRDKLALLVDNLFRRHAAVVGFDVVFAEKDESSGLKVLEGLGEKDLRGDAAYNSALMKLRQQLDYDGIFAAHIKDRPVVLGYYFTVDGEKMKKRANNGQLLPPPVLAAGSF